MLTFSEGAISRYENMQRRTLKVKKTDLQIAAVALEHNAAVVTRNARDFLRVPGSQILDWSQ
jgi:tRNA(fMet)-specific endonuclease VapC